MDNCIQIKSLNKFFGIAQALLGNPKVLIVDGPTAGLDPEERIRFQNLLTETAQERIVILSTHIVGDIEATCENIAILDEGKVLYSGIVDGLLAAADGKVFTRIADRQEVPGLKKELFITGMHTQGSMSTSAICQNIQPLILFLVNQISRMLICCI